MGGGGFGFSPLLLGLVAVAGAGLLYYLLRDKNDDDDDDGESPS
jgi:hypothetical protein